MSTGELQYRIAFSRLKGLTPPLATELLAKVGSEEQFFAQTEAQLRMFTGGASRLYDRKLRDALLDEAKSELHYILDNHIRPLYFTDDDYPQRLRSCEDAPLMIYGVGKCNLNASHVVSIVGTRHATHYGTNFVDQLVKDLAAKIDDLVIVSGLAYGIDIAAHRAAMKYGVPTVAVFGNGVATVYPASHRNDAAAMVKSGGMVLSEYFHADPIHRGNFLARNRIVAGMADALVIAESARKGGALVTARIAAAYGRDIFALPGRTSDPYSAGCNRLIADNVAALVENADNIIAAMRWTPRPTEGEQPPLPVELSHEEQLVVDYLTQKGEARLNPMGVALNINVGKLMSVLVDLEFKGLVLPFPGGLYRRAN